MDQGIDHHESIPFSFHFYKNKGIITYRSNDYGIKDIGDNYEDENTSVEDHIRFVQPALSM